MASPSRITVIEKKRLYVGCGLTLAPQSFKDDVERLKDELRQDWKVMEFLGLVAGTAADVYQRDIIENVGKCDTFLAVVDEPSLGLGLEIGDAIRLVKPTLAVAQTKANVTRLLLGATEYFENFNFRRYEDMVRDVPGIVRLEFAHVLGSSAVSQQAVVSPAQ
jgi:nucleoside 2-deoxyribosyltransferase